jgi:hypothetical protein
MDTFIVHDRLKLKSPETLNYAFFNRKIQRKRAFRNIKMKILKTSANVYETVGKLFSKVIPQMMHR